MDSTHGNRVVVYLSFMKIMKLKKMLAVIMTAVVATGMLAGCGSSSDEKTRLIFTSSRRSLHFCHFLYFSLCKQYAKIEVSFMLIDEETFQRRGFSDVIFCFIEGNPGAEAWFTRRFLGIRSQ